jgi:hypothetical protein
MRATTIPRHADARDALCAPGRTGLSCAPA